MEIKKRTTGVDPTTLKRRGRNRVASILLVFLWFMVACEGDRQAPLESPTPYRRPSPTPIPPTTVKATETSLPTKTSTPPTITPTEEEVGSQYGEAFGIDYDHPALYLRQGEQTQIPNPGLLPDLSTTEGGIEELRQIYHWMKGEFNSFRAGGKTIGTVTVEELFGQRKLGGCHDHALLFSAIARAFGYPTVIMETYSISWMTDYQEGVSEGYVGHVFVEVYLEDRWVLVDPTNGWYVVEGYDPGNPFIPLTGNVSGPSHEADGFWVDLKGVDSWDMGIYSVSDLNRRMESAASQFDLEAMEVPSYAFERF